MGAARKPPARTTRTAKAPPAARRGPGQPPALTYEVQDRIVNAVAAGNYIEAAAASAGISKQSVYEWQRIGARVKRREHAAHDKGETPDKRTDHEHRCVAFSDAVDRAQADAEITDNLRLYRLAEGGATITKTVEKRDPAGNLLERTTTTEETLPNPAVIMWRLERRFPDRWGRRRLEVTGADGGPIEVTSPLDMLRGELDRIREQHATLDPMLAGVASEAQPPVNGNGHRH
jgi:hypothetical protein